MKTVMGGRKANWRREIQGLSTGEARRQTLVGLRQHLRLWRRHLIEETNAWSTLVARYLQSLNIDEPLAIPQNARISGQARSRSSAAMIRGLRRP